MDVLDKQLDRRLGTQKRDFFFFPKDGFGVIDLWRAFRKQDWKISLREKVGREKRAQENRPREKGQEESRKLSVRKLKGRESRGGHTINCFLCNAAQPPALRLPFKGAAFSSSS